MIMRYVWDDRRGTATRALTLKPAAAFAMVHGHTAMPLPWRMSHMLA